MTNTDPASSTPANDFKPEQRLAGCYILRQKLDAPGEPVWLAHDEALGKDVSLHFIPAELRSEARAMDELRQEVKRHRQLIHPNILRIYDFIEEAEWAAISMDAYDGESLAALLQKKNGGVFDPCEIRPWIGQLCQTLQDAHKIQLVHRALSPANVFLDKNGRAFVAHFGISRAINEAVARTRGAGEPEPGLAAMSPQQLDGDRPSPLDDVYSLGALMHELLVGQPVFTSGDLVPQIRRSVPKLLSERRAELGKGAEAIPPAWDRAVALALEKNPELRPATMTDFATQLGADKSTAVVPAVVPVASAAASVAAPPVSNPELAKAGESLKESDSSIRENAPAASILQGQVRTSAPPAPTGEITRSGDRAAGEEGEKLKPAEILQRKAEAYRAAVAEKAAKAAASKTSDPTAKTAGKKAEKKPVQEKVETVSAAPAPVITRAAKKKGEEPPSPFEPAVPDHYPSLGPRRAGNRLGWLAAAAVLIAVGVYGYVFYQPADVERDTSDPLTAGAIGAEGFEFTAVSNAGEASAPPAGLDSEPGSGSLTLPDGSPLAAGSNSDSAAMEMAQATKPRAGTPRRGARSTPTRAPKKSEEKTAASAAAAATAPAGTDVSPEVMADPEVAAKAAELAKAREAMEAAEKKHQQILQQQEKAEAAAAEARKGFEERMKATEPLLKEAEAIVAERQKRAEEAKAADDAAKQAQQLAAEKAQMAEEARKALAQVEAQGKEKLAAQEKAEAELKSYGTVMEERKKQIADAVSAAAALATERQQLTAAFKRTEQELNTARAAAEENRRKFAEMEAARLAKAKEQERIKSEMSEAKKLFDEQMKALEEARERMKALEKALSDAAGEPAPAVKPEPAAPPTSSTPPAPPSGASEAPGSPKTPDTTVAMKTSPPPTVLPQPVEAEPAVEKISEEKGKGVAGPGFVNSLGLKFVPVGNVLFSVWTTRVKDFETFASETGLKSTLWKDPGFKQGPDHPVVNVTWQEAIAFCKWLTVNERKQGLISANQSYRLPTDLEWSRAVGLPEEAGKTPEDRDMEIQDVYPWGTTWPPPPGSGNYTGEETGSDVAVKGYDDGFAWTSPVGTFPPNQYGLYDMGGNVWQWCMDTRNPQDKARVLRGASWYNGALRLSLLSSCRIYAAPDSSTDNFGFRCVIATESGRASRR